jgi:cytochrome P450 family 142 subfamily A polypeptide 1
MVRKLETAFRQIATETIDEIAGRGECDFVDDVAVPMPLLLIAEMIGIRREDRERFHRWSDDLIAGDGNLDNPEVMERAGRALREYGDYLKEIFEDRRRQPQDDLISILVGARDQGLIGENRYETDPETGSINTASIEKIEETRDLATDELVMLMVLLLVAGNETTRNGISGGMSLLIENPGERQKLIDDPSLIAGAVEEMVRLVSPVQSFGRTATQDTELRGEKIRKGDTVLMLYPAANRDPDEFEDPDAFKIDRDPRHLAFGVGNHFCLGANLARIPAAGRRSGLLPWCVPSFTCRSATPRRLESPRSAQLLRIALPRESDLPASPNPPQRNHMTALIPPPTRDAHY